MPEKESGYVMVFMTAPGAAEAERMGRAVVEEGLAACCNVVPGLKSIYTWKGEVCAEEEVLCIMKTRKALFEPLKTRLRGLHSYEVPEIIAVEIAAGLSEYLGWIDEVTGPRG